MRNLLLAALCAPALALAQSNGELRTGFIQCGQSQITARADCFGKTAYCLTETLSFARRNGRSIVPLHRNFALQDVGGKRVKVLEYHADAWACLPGKMGGSYLVVVMKRDADPKCRDCEYSRLYDLNGRLIASDVSFDARGQARENGPGREMMNEVLGGPGPHAFIDVYPRP